MGLPEVSTVTGSFHILQTRNMQGVCDQTRHLSLQSVLDQFVHFMSRYAFIRETALSEITNSLGTMQLSAEYTNENMIELYMCK